MIPTNHVPRPEMAPVPDQQIEEMGALLKHAIAVVDDQAGTLIGPNTGDYYVLTGEGVAVPLNAGYNPATGEISRPELAENRYFVKLGNGTGQDEEGAAQEELTLNEQGDLQGEALVAYGGLVVAVRSGEAPGEHWLSASKLLVSGGVEDEALRVATTMNVAVRFSSDRTGGMAAAADLRLARTYNDPQGDDYPQRVLHQCRRVELTHGGALLAGNVVVDETVFVDMQSYDAATDTIAGRQVFEPLDAWAAMRLQDRFQPTPPVGDPITSTQWMQLLQQPLSPNSFLQ